MQSVRDAVQWLRSAGPVAALAAPAWTPPLPV